MRAQSLFACLLLGCAGSQPRAERPHADLIRVASPAFGALVASPLRVTGEARGSWYFEATFPIAILDAHGNVLGRHYAQAGGDWMTTDFVPFTAELAFEPPETPDGTLVLERANASGLAEHAAEVRVPVRFREK